MASEKILKFIEDIKALSVLELAELVDAIQEEFGVTAAVAAAPAAGGAAAAEEKTEFDVVRKLLNQLLRLSRKAFLRQKLKNLRQSLKKLALQSKSSNLLQKFQKTSSY